MIRLNPCAISGLALILAVGLFPDPRPGPRNNSPKELCMKKPRVFALLFAALLAGCAPLTVHMDYDPDADFSRYRTFAWMPEPQDHKPAASLSSPFAGKRIKQAVLENLTARGYQKTTDDPDLLIACHLTFKNRSTVSVSDYGYWGPHAIDVRRYKEGTLILDFVDPQSKQLVWRGWSVSALHPASSPQEEQEIIDRAVGEILRQFPPYALAEKGDQS
jgi:hypothetical protein